MLDISPFGTGCILERDSRRCDSNKERNTPSNPLTNPYRTAEAGFDKVDNQRNEDQ
jgi:hypothetical protein